MNVRFMDTSIVMNLLEIPKMCSDAKAVKEEFYSAVNAGETLMSGYKEDLTMKRRRSK